MPDLKTIINTLPLSIFVVDRERRILLSNRLANEKYCIDRRKSKVFRFGDIVGCPNAKENATGCGFSQFCHLCQVKEMVDRAFATKKSIAQFETDIGTHSMGISSLRMTVTYLSVDERLKSGQEMCIITLEDITELKKKERLAAATETIGAICHEMNQPLQAIMGNVELLKISQIDNTAILKIEKIYQELERIKRITSKLMNLTSYQTKPYLSTTILDVERSAGQPPMLQHRGKPAAVD